MKFSIYDFLILSVISTVTLMSILLFVNFLLFIYIILFMLYVFIGINMFVYFITFDCDNILLTWMLGTLIVLLWFPISLFMLIVMLINYCILRKYNEKNKETK